MRKKTFKQIHEAQAKLLYGLIVAGKSANFADRALKDFLSRTRHHVEKFNNVGRQDQVLPFQLVAMLEEWDMNKLLFDARTGNYGKLSKAFREIGDRRNELDMFTVTPEVLETIHGVGPKTSRFVIMWIRPEEEYAALDVHVLRWLREAKGFADCPENTPGNPKIYAQWENIFINIAEDLGKTPRELDVEIWEAGAKRTQRTPLPK